MYFIVYKEKNQIKKISFPKNTPKNIINDFVKNHEVIELFKNNKLSLKLFFNDYVIK